MVVDFSKLNLKDDQCLVLKNLDGTPIQVLGYAKHITAKLHYNETSELEFELPSCVNGEATPHYDDVVGMRVIDWVDVGQFILINPSKTNDGVQEIKKCRAYSLEYELTFKTIFFQEGTYEFYNPTNSTNTIIGFILEEFPDWSVGTIDSDLTGVYRTLESNNTNAYDLMKNTLQEKYQCVFDFDTYQRKINVRKADATVNTEPVYLSTENLLKEINMEEDTENICTVLDVNGADGVDIRSVNPMGTNLIYNLDYFMYQNPEQITAKKGNSYFTQTIINKWNNWKNTYEENKEKYFKLTVDKVLKEAKLELRNADLIKLNGELAKFRELQSVYAEADAMYHNKSEELQAVKKDIKNKEVEISSQKLVIEMLERQIEDYYSQQVEINEECSFENFFTEKELSVLRKYFKVGSVAESSFVYREVSSYTGNDYCNDFIETTTYISGAKIEDIAPEEGAVSTYSITGGHVGISGTIINEEGDEEEIVIFSEEDEDYPTKIVRGTIEKNEEDGSYVMSLYLSSGYDERGVFDNGVITSVGSVNRLSVSTKSGNVTLVGRNSSVYFTKNVSEYQKRSVEWDLMEFGSENLRKSAWPTYSFSISSANFMALDDFTVFKNRLSLGHKIYLDTGDMVLTPILISVGVDVDNPASLSLEFGDKYSLNDAAFNLVDLLQQSVSAGKTVSANKLSYSAFVDSGASTEVKKFMNSALESSKNKILAGQDQSIQIDGSGISFMKADGRGGYDDKQMRMINNSIVFTDDGWESAKMAIGEFQDANTGTSWGVVAPNIVGTLIAGSNLVIESTKPDGSNMAFKVDSTGAKLYNSQFDIVNKYTEDGTEKTGQIHQSSPIGIVGGTYYGSHNLFTYDDNGDINGVLFEDGTSKDYIGTIRSDNLPRASFWLDTKGDAYIKGTVYATDGEFSGKLKAVTGEFSGVVDARQFKLDGIDISNIFEAQKDGDTNYLKIGQITINGTDGSIMWDTITSNSPIAYMYNTVPSDIGAHADPTDSDLYRKERFGGGAWGDWYQFRGTDGKNGSPGRDGKDFSGYNWITQTKISGQSIESPTISANEVRVSNKFTVGSVAGATFEPIGYMGYAMGKDQDENITYGVALSQYKDIIDFETQSNYVIVTDKGVRLQTVGHTMFLVPAGAYYDNHLMATVEWGSTLPAAGHKGRIFLQT